MSKKEVIAYAITHAPRGQKGGPYEADDEGTWGTATPSLRPGHAVRWRTRPTQERVDGVLRHVREVHPHARVIRIVRKARPSRLCDACGFLIEAESRRRTPSEASAVEVLRELVAYPGPGAPLAYIQASARRVLAASGPDPSEVVRAALSWSEATAANGTARTVALQLACVAYRKAGGK